MIKPGFYANPVRSYTTQRTQMTGDALLCQHLRFITISLTNSFEGHLIKGHMANDICIDSRVRSRWGAIANPHAKF